MKTVVTWEETMWSSWEEYRKDRDSNYVRFINRPKSEVCSGNCYDEDQNGNIVRSFDEIVEYLKNSNDRSKKIIRIYGETIPNLIEVKLTKNSSTEVNWSISGDDYAELKYEIIYSGTRDTGIVKGSKGTIKLSSTINYAYAHAIVRIIEVKVKSEYNGLYDTKYKAESITVDKLFGGGTGTSSNPYIISNSEQFKNLYNFMEYSGTYNLYEYKIEFPKYH